MISHYIHRFFSWQVYGLFYHLDPVAQKGKPAIVAISGEPSGFSEPGSSESSSSNWDSHFLLPLCLIILGTFYGNVILPVFGADVRVASLSTSQTLIYRQMFPPAMRQQMDMAVITVVLASIAIYASFLRYPWTLHRYVNVGTVEKPLLRIGNSTLSVDSSLKILRFRRRIRKSSFTTLAICVVAIFLFLYGNILLNRYYSWTNEHFLVALVLLFPTYVSVLYALFGISTFVILASYFTQIRQKGIISQMKEINEQLKQLDGKASIPQKWTQFLLVQQNWSLNQTVFSICTQLEAYATYWKAALTPFFLNHIILQTYLAYTVFLIDGLILFQKIAFIYMVLEIDLLLFLLIDVCARVVKLKGTVCAWPVLSF